MNILIVEDSPLLRKMYSLAFPGRHHRLTTAENGRAALRLLQGDPSCELILLDLRMPDMDGVEFIHSLRAAPGIRSIPIVVTTAEPEHSELVRQARALGVAAVVRKPWKPHELRDLVHGLIPESPR